MTLIKPNYFLDGVMREVATKYNIPFVKVQECMAAHYGLRILKNLTELENGREMR